MRKFSFVVPMALVSFLGASSAFAGLVIKNDGTSVWDAKATAQTCVYTAAPGSDRTIANDGTVIAVKPSARKCVGGVDYKDLTREQFDELSTKLSS